MAVQVTYPGVYVQEVPSGVRTIVGVSTSIACFVGRTKTGPMMQPRRIQSLTDFLRVFGDDPTVGDLSRYVRLFFLNGGTDCYVTRIANGPVASSITLQSESKANALQLTALSAGALGDTIRVAVDYNTQTPDSTFNIVLFQAGVDNRGQPTQVGREVWPNLSMDPNSPSYAQTVLTQKSALVNAKDVSGGAGAGYSMAGKPIVYDPADLADVKAKFAAAFPNKGAFLISVDGSPGSVVLPDPAAVAGGTVALLRDGFRDAIRTAIDNALSGGVQADVEIADGPLVGGPGGLESAVVVISSKNNGDVIVQSAAANDVAAGLGLGLANGGVEVGAYGASRPAPTGVVYNAYRRGSLTGAAEFLNLKQAAVAAVDHVTLDGFDANGALVDAPVALALADAAAPADTHFWQGSSLATKLQRWVDQVNAFHAANFATFRWQAQLWGYRVAFIPTAGGDNDLPAFKTAPSNIAAGPPASLVVNVRYDALGKAGAPLYQTAGAPGSNGGPPQAKDYDAAYVEIDHDVDLFNLLVLPPERSAGATPVQNLYAAASIFCQQRRAFLIMDPPDGWTSPQVATSNVSTFRIGSVKDHSAVYYPRLTVNESGLKVTVGPAGAIAGVYARTDANVGVWKAPAGTQADIRGVNGVDLNLTDGENGQLNPVGVNAIRVMPEGVLSWGARTNDGADIFASEYKYVPIRRLALFMEESLLRGLRWVVFEENDAPLWAQIRLNVGSFMNNLFRNGAFQGATPAEAYFVKCDAETTTQNDRNLGIVNIWVGFAPLKPAEFVVLMLQQIAGALQT